MILVSGLKTKTVCDSWFIDLSLNCMANEMLNVTSITLHPKEPYTCANPAQSNCSKNMTRLLGRRCSNRRRCSLSELPLYERTCCRRLLNCLSVNYTCVQGKLFQNDNETYDKELIPTWECHSPTWAIICKCWKNTCSVFISQCSAVQFSQHQR